MLQKMAIKNKTTASNNIVRLQIGFLCGYPIWQCLLTNAFSDPFVMHNLVSEGVVPKTVSLIAA